MPAGAHKLQPVTQLPKQFLVGKTLRHERLSNSAWMCFGAPEYHCKPLSTMARQGGIAERTDTPPSQVQFLSPKGRLGRDHPRERRNEYRSLKRMDRPTQPGLSVFHSGNS